MQGLIFFSACIIHEFVHYFHALSSFKNVKLVPWNYKGIPLGVFTQYDNEDNKQFYTKKLINVGVGIVAGLLIIWLFNLDVVWLWAYNFVCLLDWMILFAIAYDKIKAIYSPRR